MYLWVARMKASLWHIKWITSGTHHASEQVRLPLHTSKRGQFSVNYMAVEDTVEISCCLTCPWLRPFISFVRKSQLFLEILPDPLCQLCRQPAQHGVGRSVNILQPIWIRNLSFAEGQGGCRFLYKLDSAGFDKVYIKSHKTLLVSVACLIIQ